MSGPSVKIPVDWLDSDTSEDLGSDAVLLMVSALGYAARQTSNGLVPRRRLRKLWPVKDLDDCLERLTNAGEVQDQDDDVLFVNWRDFIMEADEVDRRKILNRERTERSRRHKGGDHSLCRPSYCREASPSRDESRHTSRDGDGTAHVSAADPTRPLPTRTIERGGREGGRGAVAASSAKATEADADPAPWSPQLVVTDRRQRKQE